MKALIDEAHERGIKVFFDIVTNHTADVVSYAEGKFDYQDKSAHAYTDASGEPFDDRDYAGGEEFPELDPKSSFPYTPTFPTEQDATARTPDWLNDPTMYHNRGDPTFEGESTEYGDFYGLDDVFTERPEVVRGMTYIYRTWVKQSGVDGFRIDTVKHVNIEFWQQFVPELQGYAASLGNEDFFMFSEVLDGDPAFVSRYTKKGKLPAALDFPFQGAARAYVGGSEPATRLRDVFMQDDRYTDADSNVYSMPTFLGNHDLGRIGSFLSGATASADDSTMLAKGRLAHALVYLSRGQPVVYYGDEQGFTGAEGDQAARQSMFASRAESYLDDDLIGTDATHAQDNYNRDHPLYRMIADLARLTEKHPALRDGAQVERWSDTDGPGVYAFSRTEADEQLEYVVAFNNADRPRTRTLSTYSAGMRFEPLWSTGKLGEVVTTGKDRRIEITVPATGAVVYRAERPTPPPAEGPSIELSAPGAGSEVSGEVDVTADVPGGNFAQVAFAVTAGDGERRRLGTDDNPAYRVYHDTANVDAGTSITYEAVVRDTAGRMATDAITVTKGG